MFEETVTTKAGTEKRIVAGSKQELKEAVDAAKNESVPTTPDINVPVAKGRDLLAVGEDGVTVGLADGRGAHNSPENAVNDDGSLNGDPDVPFVVQSRNVGTAQATNESLQKLGEDGKLTDLTDEDVEKADKATNPAPKK